MALKGFKLNGRGIQSYLDGDHGVEAMLRAKAERVLAAAIADPHDDTGDYENGLHLEEAHTDRLVIRIVSGDWKGYIMEANYGVLARALDSA